MKHSARYTLIALGVAAPILSAASPMVNKRPAESRVITLQPHTATHVLPSSNIGVVLITLTDTSLLVNERATTLRAGQPYQISGSRMLDIVNTSALPAELVLVKVDTATQTLTIMREELDVHQELEDASDRNDTLVVALTPIDLRDVRDLADEGNHWKSSSPKTLRLHPGQTAWLTPGMHRLVNIGTAKARFVTIEW